MASFVHSGMQKNRTERACATRTRTSGRLRQRGQVIVIFAGGLVFFIGLMAVVIDVSWIWANTLRVQRTADAAALAGSPYLPASTVNAYKYAVAEAAKNGYTLTNGCNADNKTPSSVPGICASQDSVAVVGGDPRQLDVTVSAQVPTFFMRIFGISTITASRTAKGIYVQPVPMGSPENYYGIYCLTTPSNSNCDATTSVPNATGSGTLASKGFWGAFQSSGDVHNEGDAFMPFNDTLDPGSNSSLPAGGTNPDYTGTGYDYAVVVPADGGKVYIYDPTFCPVGGGYGSGDHYNADASRQWGFGSGKNFSVSSYYALYDTQGTAFTISDDTLVASSGNLFAQEYQFDYSHKYGTAGYEVSVGNKSLDNVAAIDCSEGKIPVGSSSTEGGYWHDRWWPIATNVPAGTYRLSVLSGPVDTTCGAGNVAPKCNWKAQAENDFGIEVTGPNDTQVPPNSPRVYGLGKMAAYNILPSGVQSFYLAQIDKSAAGKTLEIDLFDPGDVSGEGTLRIKNPNGNAYNYATFDYKSINLTTAGNNCNAGTSDACSANGRTSIKTATGGNSSFNNTWIQITIKLPTTYGSGCSGDPSCLKPPGETQPGWWKIEYTVSGGNDTTTWMVNIRGNPVHLVVP